jgi:hypothetical protein
MITSSNTTQVNNKHLSTKDTMTVYPGKRKPIWLLARVGDHKWGRRY